MPRIEVKGNVYSHRSEPMKQMADMLRYDDGEVERIEREGTSFTAIVQARSYTPGRWRSFGLKTRAI